MAARKRNWQTNKTREKIRDSIKVGQIVTRFEKHVLAQTEEEREATKLSASQLKAGEILLQRTLPTLSSAEIVETTPEPKMDEAFNQLVAMVGEEMANKLISGKAKIEHEHTKTVEPIIVHEQPDQTQ